MIKLPYFGRIVTFLVDIREYHLPWLGRTAFRKLSFCSFMKIFKCFNRSCLWLFLVKGFSLINLCVYLSASQKNYTDLFILLSVIIIDCSTNSFCMVKVLSIVYIALIQKRVFPTIIPSVYFFVYTKMRNELDRGGTTLNELKLPENTCNDMDSTTNWHKIHRKKLCVQWYCSIEYRNKNSHCRKEHHLRRLHIKVPEMEWNQQQGGTNKDTHRTILCV